MRRWLVLFFLSGILFSHNSLFAEAIYSKYKIPTYIKSINYPEKELYQIVSRLNQESSLRMYQIKNAPQAYSILFSPRGNSSIKIFLNLNIDNTSLTTEGSSISGWGREEDLMHLYKKDLDGIIKRILEIP